MIPENSRPKNGSLSGQAPVLGFVPRPSIGAYVDLSHIFGKIVLHED